MKQYGIGLIGAACLLAGCASSAPEHFHTLDNGMMSSGVSLGTQRGQVSPVQLAGTDDAERSGRVRIAVERVTVPERLNRSNLVLLASQQTAASGTEAGVSSTVAGAGKRGAERPSATSVEILEQDRWEASLGDAMRDALAAQLARRGARPDSGAAPMRVDLQVYRFDGSRDGWLDVLIDWKLHRLGKSDEADAVRSLSCRYAVRGEKARAGVDGLVSAMQEQVSLLADEIVASGQRWVQTGQASCPGDRQTTHDVEPAS